MSSLVQWPDIIIQLNYEKVISLVPPNWSLNVLSSFLARSLRRTLHARHEGQIVKSISAGQNLEVIFFDV
jgi:hypothetical protein